MCMHRTINLPEFCTIKIEGRLMHCFGEWYAMCPVYSEKKKHKKTQAIPI